MKRLEQKVKGFLCLPITESAERKIGDVGMLEATIIKSGVVLTKSQMTAMDVLNTIEGLEEILKELETLFKSKEFREKLAVNDKTCYLEGKYFPQLNVIADVDTNLFPKLNTSADFDSNQYIVMKIASLDTVQESIDTVRVNFAKLSFSLEK